MHWPPRPHHPLLEKNDRKLAHSLRFVLPKTTAPAFRRFATTVESVSAGVPTRAREPAADCILSWVSILSFRRIGIPMRGPRKVPALLCESSCEAMDVASGLVWSMELRKGPLASMAVIRERYMLTRLRELSVPAIIWACNWAIVASSMLEAGPVWNRELGV